MRRWGGRFTCIAPDTPGYGQSDPLPDPGATIDGFSDALVALLDALGLNRVAAYGFHSGGIILVNTLARAPQRFSAPAIGGYIYFRRGGLDQWRRSAPGMTVGLFLTSPA